MKETGVVHSVERDEALVRIKRHSACMSCKACSAASDGNMLIKAFSGGNVKAGDEVSVEIDSVSVIKAIAMVYILPTIAFLAGIFAGMKAAPVLGIHESKEAFSIVTGTALLGASLLLARCYGIKRKDAYKARITGLINGGV